MAPNDGKPSDFERRTSLRRSVGLSVQGGDEDEFALAALGISDGFRPEEPSASVTTTTPDSMASARRATPAHLVDSQALDINPGPPIRHATPTPSVAASARPSSIAKTRRHDSFSLRHDGVMGPVNNKSVVSRQSSVSTENPFVAAEAEQPYEGPSGPSHPYQMYPQNVRAARTASIATTSTAAPLSERPYNGPIGPSHPYGMYPQNIVGDAAGMSVNNVAPPALVGFPGMTDQYRRRVGPDGDGTDLIGPDGHTEELPPYTRYPQGGYAPKPVQVGQQSAAGATVQPAQRLYDGQPSSDGAIAGAIPAGAGGIGLATLNPEFNTSADDVGSPQSRYSAHSFASESSRDRINAAAEPASEKPTESKWKQRARKKLWGVIPYWAICLTLTAVVLMGIIVGAIIGSFLSGRKPHHPAPGNSPAVSATVTVTLDATPLQTKPATLRDLQTGDFALPIVIPSRQSATCFNNTLQANAWSCTIVFSQMKMSVFKVEGNPDTANYAMHLGCNSSLTLNNGTFSYGTQPPCFNQNFTMNLVTDIYEPSRGPAWFFQHAYDKTVILPQDSLTVADTVEAHLDTGVSIKRGSFPGGFNPFGSDVKRKNMAQPGEKPWFCTWGGTLLEVFVYANQDSNAYRDYTASARSSSCLPTSTTFSSTPPAATSAAVTGYSSTQSSSSERSVKTKRNHSEVTIAVSHTTTDTNPPQTGTANPNATSTYGQWVQTGLALPPPPYPRVVKVEERRMSGPPAQAPICQQWEILEGSERRPARDSNGKEIIIQIVENEPVPTLVTVNAAAKTTGNASRRKRDITKKVQMSRDEIMRTFDGVYYVDEKGFLSQRDTQLVGQDLSNCGCLWWSN